MYIIYNTKILFKLFSKQIISNLPPEESISFFLKHFLDMKIQYKLLTNFLTQTIFIQTTFLTFIIQKRHKEYGN